jgi:hypothetical protein
MIACPVLWLNGTAICTANMPNVHAALSCHLSLDSLKRKAVKERLAMVAAEAAAVIS